MSSPPPTSGAGNAGSTGPRRQDHLKSVGVDRGIDGPILRRSEPGPHHCSTSRRPAQVTRGVVITLHSWGNQIVERARIIFEQLGFQENGLPWAAGVDSPEIACGRTQFTPRGVPTAAPSEVYARTSDNIGLEAGSQTRPRSITPRLPTSRTNPPLGKTATTLLPPLLSSQDRRLSATLNSFRTPSDTLMFSRTDLLIAVRN